MTDSLSTLAQLRARIAAVEGSGAPLSSRHLSARHLPSSFVPTGHAGIDAAIGGGIAQARLHEVFAASAEDSGSAAGFAAMLSAQIARPGGTIFWLREQSAERRGGCLHAAGLAELGIDPARVILGVIDDALALLRLAAEVVRCPDIDVAVIELWRMPRPLDLTATRRLAVAAAGSGVTALLLRSDAEPSPSAAHSRWSVASAAATPLEAQAPGHPTLSLDLLRLRGGSAGATWLVEWDREQAVFREPALSGAVVPLSFGRSLATDRRRAG